MKSLKTYISWAVLLAGGCASPPHVASPLVGDDPAGSAARTPTGSEAYHGLIQYRAKDAKEAIVEPALVSAGEALLAAGTKVIGVFVNGEARAYPLFILNNHQIVNDVVGGTPISASW
jgi:hypothetical protein